MKNNINYSLEDINYIAYLKPVINQWKNNIENNKLEDLNAYENENFNYALFIEYYNHLYAAMLITIHSALEKNCILYKTI